VQRQAGQLAPRHAELGDLAGADLAARGGQLFDQQVADRVAVAAQRGRSGAPRGDRARDRDRRRGGVAERDRRELAPPRGVAIALGIGPPRARGIAGGLDDPGEIALLEEPDAGERVLAGQRGIEQPGDLGGAVPQREPRRGVAADLALELGRQAIGAEIDPEVGRDQLGSDLGLAQLAAQRELGVQLLEHALAGRARGGRPRGGLDRQLVRAERVARRAVVAEQQRAQAAPRAQRGAHDGREVVAEHHQVVRVTRHVPSRVDLGTTADPPPSTGRRSAAGDAPHAGSAHAICAHRHRPAPGPRPAR
jgi:hypothetical protein